VQLTQKAREATPRSYRPAKLYLHRLSPLTIPPVVLQTAAQTPHPPTPPGEPSLDLSPPTTPNSPPRTPCPPPPTVAVKRPPRRCLPPSFGTTP
jgi:hypothetical protein